MAIERLGPYEIGRQLGRGGMGTVYEGVNVETGEHAAIKLLSAALAGESGFRHRFEAEIETLRKLNHPNIVRLFGFGQQDDYLFYAMELVAGSSVEEQLSHGRCFDWRETTRLAIEISYALRHAHDRGVIHRDIKPGNLLWTEDGHVKLSDFGIARLFGNTRLTGVGSVLGTAEYMAPEQAEGRPIDPRTDLYSLGAVLYVVLARRPLFRAKTFMEMLQKQRTEQPEPLRLYAPDVPVELEQIIRELLEKAPERRIPNAMLLTRRLEAMEHALVLSVPTRVADEKPADGPAATTGPAAVPSVPPVDQFAPTRAATAPHPDPGALDVRLPAGNDFEVSKRLTPRDEPTPDQVGQDDAPKTSGRFVPVSPEELDAPRAEPVPAPWISPQTWALAIALVLVGLVVWYFLQPPSADALYDRIMAKTDPPTGASLTQAEDDIEQFLMSFPGDPRCEQLREYEKAIELDRLERRLAKGLNSTEKLIPIQQAYLEALNYARIDPQLGIRKMHALLDLYGDRPEPTGPTGQCIELARRRLAQLQQEIEEQAPEGLAVLQDRLNRADQLRLTDPTRARTVYRAVVELYRNKPWAADLVRRARAALAESAGSPAPASKDEKQGEKPGPKAP